MSDNKVKINRKRHIIKAVTWNVLAMATTYLVLTILPPYFGLEGISKEGEIADNMVCLFFFFMMHNFRNQMCSLV